MKLIKGKTYKIKGVSPRLPQYVKDSFSRGSLTATVEYVDSVDVIIKIKAGTEELLAIYGIEGSVAALRGASFSFTPVEVNLANK